MKTAFVIALALTSACSSAMLTLKDEWQPKNRPECNQSVARPVVDFVVSAPLMAAGGAAAWAGFTDRCTDGEFEQGDTFCASMGSLIAFWGAAHLAFGIVGVLRAQKCARAHEQHRRHLQRARPVGQNALEAE